MVGERRNRAVVTAQLHMVAEVRLHMVVAETNRMDSPAARRRDNRSPVDNQTLNTERESEREREEKILQSESRNGDAGELLVYI
ncbi:hypothetical protein IEQ34_009280 [Dendrobium chrysotoxum]|uniref:Uncharacterized protein n=1 Tax=Dendrobium chrysotoxum TaxID=161865 RepID=A0AAV7H2H5_DENCH|nr:hypothetical protein IEQ34_009280 [Dendrobium chrysotoxum]